ncbi:unnamed protein product [Orchesella dallaii]|uniref:RRM domain-containing protein n=1 Tax=Orchesella dallaii TaxID=48710 RepID=A0ABP1PKJ6_9HEXA
MMDDSVEDHDEHEEEEDEDLQNAYVSEQEGATQDSNENVTMMDDSELEAIKARVREMEEEAEKLKQLQSEVDRQMQIGSGGNSSSNLLVSSSSPSNSANSSLANSGLFPSTLSIEEKMEVDGRSIYVGNVDYGATAEELEQHFHGCGSINRVTILCNKYDGHPKGFAYIEFADKESVNTAMALDESLFRGRQIKVMIKRTNRPGLCRTDRPPRGAAPVPRGRGRGRFGYGRVAHHHRGFPSRRASSIISSSGRIMMTSTRGSSYYSPY